MNQFLNKQSLVWYFNINIFYTLISHNLSSSLLYSHCDMFTALQQNQPIDDVRTQVACLHRVFLLQTKVLQPSSLSDYHHGDVTAPAQSHCRPIRGSMSVFVWADCTAMWGVHWRECKHITQTWTLCVCVCVCVCMCVCVCVCYYGFWWAAQRGLSLRGRLWLWWRSRRPCLPKLLNMNI